MNIIPSDPRFKVLYARSTTVPFTPTPFTPFTTRINNDENSIAFLYFLRIMKRFSALKNSPLSFLKAFLIVFFYFSPSLFPLFPFPLPFPLFPFFLYFSPPNQMKAYIPLPEGGEQTEKQKNIHPCCVFFVLQEKNSLNV